MSGVEVVSFNCLYCIFPKATEEQVKKYIASRVTEIETIICQRSKSYIPNCKFAVNVLPQAGLSSTIAYAWLTNKEVAYMLRGRTHEGSIISQPTTSKDNEPIVGLSAKQQLFAMDWDEIPVTHYEPYTLPDFENTATKPVFAQAKVEIPDESYERGTLFCKSPLPSTYKAEYLVSLFAPFNTGRGPVEAVITPKGHAYIKFPVHSDACFALLLTKKHYDSERNIHMSFDYSQAREPVKRYRNGGQRR